MYDVNLSNTTILSFLDDHPLLKFVRLLWLDYVSVLRGRVLTITHFRGLVENDQYHGLGSLNMFQANNSPPDLYDGGDWGLGQSWLVPDSSSIRLQPGEDTHALIFCYFPDKLDLPLSLNSGDRCPRQVLQRAVQCAFSVEKVDFQVGFEIEFTCPPSSETGYPMTHEVSGMRTLESFMMPILCEITEKLTQVGIAVLHFHAEATIHQFEIALAPMSPMEAVDGLVIARETIWNVCCSRELVPFFSPQSPFLNGIHLNLSVVPKCSCSQHGLYRDFLASVLSHLPAICAFGLSHQSSYDRTAPSSGCVGRHIAWGTENRFVPIRQKSEGLWEFRFLDDYSNFYLLLAAIVHCGGVHIVKERYLHMKDCQVDPAMLDEEARAEYGITEELPSDLDESCDALLRDEALVKVLGGNMVSSYVSVIKRRALNGANPR